MEFEGTYDANDLHQFWKIGGTGNCIPSVTVINVEPLSAGQADDSDGTGETMLDVEVAASVCLRWRRKGYRLLWRWKSRPAGRPRLPKDLPRLIQEMAAENSTWGEERIAKELKLKLSIQVSPRTVGKYLHRDGPARPPDPKQRWLTFVMVACDFFVVSLPPSAPSTSSSS